eukprot:9079930-Pyramimonas_sp.AAC.1
MGPKTAQEGPKIAPICGFVFLECEHTPPPNATKWEELRPLKRLRGKVSFAAFAFSQTQIP